MSSFSVAFRARPDDQVMVLDLSGELDAHTAPEFEAALELALAGGHSRLIVNGAELQYVSSAGLGVFMAFVEPLRASSGDLKIAALPPRVYEVFDLLGFPLIFDMHESEDAATAAFDARGEGDQLPGDG
jgi:anti-sigma B factor antagonist